MPTNISFDGNNLQTANILTQDIKHESLPTKDARVFTLAHANASAIPFVSYPSRSIRISGVIMGSSISDLDTRLDAFKAYFLGTDKNLDMDYGGTTRRYIATVTALSIDRPGGLLYALFDIDFICTQPFGRDTSTTSISSGFSPSGTGRTAATYTDSYTFLGNAPYQLPIITITLTAVTGGTNQYIQFGNGGNGQAVLVQRTWAAADVLVIDCTQKTITVNGIPTAFSGAFPEFPPGSQSLQYTDSFTTRTFTISAVYTKAYL